MINIMKIVCLVAIILDLCVFFTQGSIAHLLFAGMMIICYNYWDGRGAA